MIKVCHVTSAHGVEDVRIFQKECISLSKAGFDVYLVERGESYDKENVHIIGIGSIPTSRLKRILFGAKKAYEKAISLDCDLYHLHDPELLPYGLKLKKKGKKVVFDSHEFTRQQITVKPYLPKWIARLMSWCYAKFENYVLKKIDGVVFPCLINGEFPIPGRNKTLLNNYPRLEELYDKYNKDDKKEFDVGMAGSLTFNRGITHLVMAINNSKCNACIGGIFETEEYEKEVKTLASDKIQFPGFLNREQVISLIKKTRVGCSALLKVGQYANLGNLPTKVYEFMAMGVPVIISDIPYNLKMIEKYKFGLCVDPENITQYEKTIKYLLDNPDKAKELGENGRKAIRDFFNWDKEFNNLLILYNKIL